MSVQDVADRVDQTRSKLDAIANVQYERAKRDLAQMRADDAEREEERRDRARRNADACRKHQARYDEAYQAGAR
jgi:hypothetical protein